MAHALRRALVSSLGLAVIAIAVAAWSSAALERSEAGADRPGAASSLARTLAELPAADTPPSSSALAVAVRPAAVELVEPRAESEPASPPRRLRVAAVEQVAGPPPPGDSVAPAEALLIKERHAEIVARAAARGDQPEIVEPPFVIAEGQTGSPPLVVGDVIEATVSFYYCDQGGASLGDGGGFCGAMRDGTAVYEGAAACAFTYLGQRFRIVGDPSERVYTCHDTGNAVLGVHRDIFFHSAADGWAWLASVGPRAILEIVG